MQQSKTSVLLQKLRRLRIFCHGIPGDIQFKVVNRLFGVMVMNPDAREEIFDEDHALEKLIQALEDEVRDAQKEAMR